MSGGAITDNHYDLVRMCDWSRNIRKEMLETRWTDWSPEMHREAEWIARVTDDLYACLYALDRTLSGDSGEERGLNAIREFRDTWFTGISRGDLAGLGEMFDNILGTVTEYSARMKTVSEAADTEHRETPSETPSDQEEKE